MTFFSYIGIGVLAIAAYFIYEELLLRKVCQCETTGVLVSVDTKSDYVYHVSGAIVFVPVYEFRANGKKYRVAAKKYSPNGLDFKPGTPCKVKYSELNPEVCIIDNRTGKLGVGLVLLAFGIILFLLGKVNAH